MTQCTPVCWKLAGKNPLLPVFGGLVLQPCLWLLPLQALRAASYQPCEALVYLSVGQLQARRRWLAGRERSIVRLK